MSFQEMSLPTQPASWSRRNMISIPETTPHFQPSPCPRGTTALTSHTTDYILESHSMCLLSLVSSPTIYLGDPLMLLCLAIVGHSHRCGKLTVCLPQTTADGHLSNFQFGFIANGAAMSLLTPASWGTHTGTALCMHTGNRVYTGPALADTGEQFPVWLY